MAKSISLAEKLNNVLKADPVVEEIESLLETTESLGMFNSSHDLKSYVTEGALLNIGKISAQALSLPHGEYMVMATDAGHTMLLPIGSSEPSTEVFESLENEFEVLTPSLIQGWQNIEKVLAERAMQPQSDVEGEENGGEESDGDQPGTFQTRIQAGSVDRSPMHRSMEQQGHTVTSLAQATGVQPPAISRLLRTPKDRQGDPGGRNPSIGLASRVANALRMDVESLFPDIFAAPKSQVGAKEVKGNRGSGTGTTGRKGKATDKWTQGAN